MAVGAMRREGKVVAPRTASGSDCIREDGLLHTLDFNKMDHAAESAPNRGGVSHQLVCLRIPVRRAVQGRSTQPSCRGQFGQSGMCLLLPGGLEHEGGPGSAMPPAITDNHHHFASLV